MGFYCRISPGNMIVVLQIQNSVGSVPCWGPNLTPNFRESRNQRDERKVQAVVARASLCGVCVCVCVCVRACVRVCVLFGLCVLFYPMDKKSITAKFEKIGRHQ